MNISEQSSTSQYTHVFSVSDTVKSSGLKQPHEGASAEPSQQVTPPTDFEAFMAAWGTSNAEFDLDGSGTVDGADLGLFLSQVTEEDEQESDQNLRSLLAPFEEDGSDPLAEQVTNSPQHSVPPEITDAIDVVRQKYARTQYTASEAITRAHSIMNSIQGSPLEMNHAANLATTSPSHDPSGVNAYALLAQLRGNEGLLM